MQILFCEECLVDYLTYRKTCPACECVVFEGEGKKVKCLDKGELGLPSVLVQNAQITIVTSYSQ